MGEQSGYIRFEEPEAGQKARAASVLAEEGGLPVKNFIVNLEPVTGMFGGWMRPELLSSLASFFWPDSLASIAMNFMTLK